MFIKKLLEYNKHPNGQTLHCFVSKFTLIPIIAIGLGLINIIFQASSMKYVSCCFSVLYYIIRIVNHKTEKQQRT